jgi:phospholipid-binding lipoprotein MlaA
MWTGGLCVMRKVTAAIALTLCLGAAGCATAPTGAPDHAVEPGDPNEAMNRRVFALNEQFDSAILLPVAQGYVDIVPAPARNGVHNFLDNLDEPVVFANDVLQGEVELACETIGRFGLNSTLGLGGLIDLATAAGIPYHTADFGQTLGVWGVGDAPYLVLPLLGPDNPRDLVGYVADLFINPLNYAGIRDYTYWGLGIGAADLLDLRARNINTLADLKRSSLDLYAARRSLYRQYRKSLIRHGKPDVKDLPEM